MPIRPCALPPNVLLARYTHGGGYTDCYTAVVARPVSQAEYIEAFYTGRLFKLERMLLARFASKPSTDAQVKQLASGTLGSFAAWRVEGRSADQLLMCDYTGRTRSWLMVASEGADGRAATRLYFGSAVVPVIDKATGQPAMGFMFKALLGFHKLYSRALLSAAHSRLAGAARPGAGERDDA